MARMIPSQGPKSNDSYRAEPTMYQALKEQLPDTFTVIHSLPWLTSTVKMAFQGPAITGEIDFLILHPDLGILAIEAKGGVVRYDEGQFVLRDGTRIDPIYQVRKNVHSLSRLIFARGGPALRVGYALAFPESSMQGKLLPPALQDMTDSHAETICIDYHDLPAIRERIEAIMAFWKRHGVTWGIGASTIEEVVKLICPVEDYSLPWQERIKRDSQWLLLTKNQAKLSERIAQKQHAVLTGRSGTGKTLLANIRAHALASQGKRVLYLMYNSQLAATTRQHLAGTDVQIETFHSLCRKACTLLNMPIDPPDQTWFQEGGPTALREAIRAGLFPDMGALIIDEAQVFAPEWLADLCGWFREQSILLCCDETQVFSYEKHTKLQQMLQIVGVTNPLILTENVRSPRAIFERLETALPADYTQFSPRSEDPDAFVELTVHNPLTVLQQTIQQLHDDGIPPEDIMLLYASEKPQLEPHLYLMVDTITSIFRSRGLEAPVVIVWLSTRADDIPLLCAFSRATSRCIVIYNIATFLQPGLSPLYQQIISERGFQAAIDDRYSKSLEAQKILSTPQLYWSSRWQGWILTYSQEEKHRASKTLERDLWIAYIKATASHPLYVGILSAYSTLHVYTPAQIPGNDVDARISFQWCEKEEQWSRFAWRSRKSPQLCLDCLKLEFEQTENFSETATLYIQTARALQMGKPLPIASIPVLLLQKWMQLTPRENFFIACHTHNLEPTEVYPLCKLFVGLTIAAKAVGDIFTTEEIFQEALRLPGASAKAREWNKYVKLALSKWRDITWLEQLEKGKYRRAVLPPFNPDQQQMWEEKQKREAGKTNSNEIDVNKISF
ncbi:hypothetical protein KSC_063170 [Ktedonobacter sp. SOSP1-52]|uniref:nuclease-related domain-containing DEAD/DEAH box helicase n=1 Tax=Ktedonobacter sp. SOSP1-52 TaxID=2778366 RepID=UPI001915CDB9|nr:NERD domain-containing protein [Ktedonobacter sp. SOSP1-52]GHO67425.1 hypothetical protein KSC_063170 [Ktedonobacter sp. SOSP1-52]